MVCPALILHRDYDIDPTSELHDPEEDPSTPSYHARDSRCGEEVEEYMEELSELQSAVGML